jgi:diguanylate cyclase (GGDEF)-like protein
MLSALVFLWYFAMAGMLGHELTFASLAPTVALIGGCLVGVFAVARVWLAGVAGVSRSALLSLAGAGVTTVVAEALTPTLVGTPQLRFALALSTLFYAFIMAAPLLQLWTPPEERHGAVRRGRPATTLPFVAVATTQVLLVVDLMGELGVRAWGVLFGAVALTALVAVRQIVALRDNSRLMVRLNASLAGQRQAVARSTVLADTGTTLMTAPSAEHILKLAADAADQLLEGESRDCRVVALAGDASPVSDDLSRWAVLLPLQYADRRYGTLAADGGVQLSADVLKSLDTLRVQVSLALERIALTEELTSRALHDPLTGLANRALIHERIEQALSAADGADHGVAVLLLDLNGFKGINDTWGHQAGDDLLRHIGRRLTDVLLTGDVLRFGATVGRLGGDEFVVIAEHVASLDEARALAAGITRALAPPAICAGQTVAVRASIGIALSDGQVRDVDEILRHADAAMYEEKRGLNRAVRS